MPSKIADITGSLLPDDVIVSSKREILSLWLLGSVSVKIAIALKVAHVFWYNT